MGANFCSGLRNEGDEFNRLTAHLATEGRPCSAKGSQRAISNCNEIETIYRGIFVEDRDLKELPSFS